MSNKKKHLGKRISKSFSIKGTVNRNDKNVTFKSKHYSCSSWSTGNA